MNQSNIHPTAYRLQLLWEDDGLALFRRLGSDGSLEKPELVTIPLAEHPPPTTLKRIAHEFGLREDLDPVWAALPLRLENEPNRHALVLHDPGGQSLASLLGASLEVGRFLELAVGIVAALRKVHRAGLIHKDIKPANIIVDCPDGYVRLTGFGFASRLARERCMAEAPDIIAGTLPYMAPEQTGRMNRSVDVRSDLYALGVTYYEMLVGALPFAADEPMAWVHCHIARKPIPPRERVPDIPIQLSAIVTKLLAKSAEERYQTSAGLEADLRRCLNQWQVDGHIVPFELGSEDASDQLVTPEKLYGRETEIDTLREALKQVSTSGVKGFVLISGYSGVGKSSIVKELEREISLSKNLFVAGKFDQYRRNIPYSTLSQAFRTLIGRILAGRDDELVRWRQDLSDALGPYGQLVVNLVPELVIVLGEQPPIGELPPQDAQNRFLQTFRRFVGVFARADHPLVLFLDDLQWLDTATLELVEHLAVHPDVRYLLLIGAVRDNEVDSSHPLSRTVAAIHAAGGCVREIALAPLSHSDVTRLLADTLVLPPERVEPLTDLVHRRTAGNPFFAIQFVMMLVDEGLLTFSHDAMTWVWDSRRIQEKSFSDNVVDLMVRKMTRLSADTQEALQMLACLGNVVTHRALSALSRELDWHNQTSDVHKVLREAVRVGLVLPLEGSYAFAHDRVQQAAYSMVPHAERAARHGRIGQALLAGLSAAELDKQLFEVVDHINRGAELLDSEDERIRAAELNLRVGVKAKISAAYESACSYLETGVEMLAADDWQRHYALMFALRLELAECAFLRGDLDKADLHIADLLRHGASKIDLASAYHLKILLHIVKSENPQAVDSALTCLRLFGIDLPAHPSWDEAQAEYEEIDRRLAGRTFDDLIELPLMTDPDLLAVMRLLSVLCDPAYVTDQNLLCLELCRAINLGIEHGVSGAFAHACGYLAWPLATLFGRYPESFNLAQLGCDVVAKHGFVSYQPKILDATGIAAFWTRPLTTSLDFVRASFRSAIEHGDLTYACYAKYHTVTLLLVLNEPLDAVEREADIARDFIRRAKFRDMEDTVVPQQRFIAAMQGRTSSLSSFSDDEFDQAAFEAQLVGGRMPTMICWYWIMRGKTLFLAGEPAQARDAMDKAKALLWSSTGHFPLIDYYSYAALALTSLHDRDQTNAENRSDELTLLVDRLKEWAEVNQDSFGDRYALVSAELARIEGRQFDAIRGYEQAIASARRQGFVQNEALAHELAARFYAGESLKTLAYAAIRNARHCYARWGAAGKVRQLETLQPQLFADAVSLGNTSTISTPVKDLDLATVLKVSQAISNEIVLDKLIDSLMRIAIEHAAAERAVLILHSGTKLMIEAVATTDGQTTLVALESKPLDDDELPESIIKYCARTNEILQIAHASAEGQFSADPYIRRRRARSILCMPLLKQTKLIGLLYLENNLATHAFTPAKIPVLTLLASQAAASIETTRLYKDVAEREGKIRRLIEAGIIGIFMWERDGRLIDANDAFLRMVQQGREELEAGLRWFDMTPEEWRARIPKELEELDATGVMLPIEKEFFRKDGSRVPVLIGAATFEGQPHQGVAYVLDLTEQKQAEHVARESERRYREVQTELAHANRVATMGQLTGSIAHEVNQPIAATVINAQAALRWLGRDQPVLEEVRRSLEQIVRDGTRAADVVERIRSLMKRTGPQTERLDLNGLVREVIELVRNELIKQSVSIEYELSRGKLYGLGDRVQIQQVILNLVMNAVEAMSGCSAADRKISVSTHCDAPDEVVVTIADTGPGIRSELATRIFEPFYTTKRDGMGMGLSICRSIIEAHHGRIWAMSNKPTGALFQFAIPKTGEGRLKDLRASRAGRSGDLVSGSATDLAKDRLALSTPMLERALDKTA